MAVVDNLLCILGYTAVGCNMSRMAQCGRSPRTLLETAQALRSVLYSTNGTLPLREMVIEAEDIDAPAPSAVPAASTGFILTEVERVLLEIRQDLDIAVKESTTDSPLMTRIRDHTNEIGKTLTGEALRDDSQQATTVQLIHDLSTLHASVDTGRPSSSCIII